jgi:hypothetical protein
MIYPLMLDLQVEHWRALLAQGESIEPTTFNVNATDFAGRRREIVARLLRDYDQPLQRTLMRLSFAPRIDRSVFENIVRTFRTGMPLDAFDKLSGLSLVRRQIDGSLTIHELLAEALRGLSDEATRRETLQALEANSQPGAKSPDTLSQSKNPESRKSAILKELATLASPQPSLTKDGRLDARPNSIYDAPTVDAELNSLPNRQRKLIAIIRGDLPQNAPKHLKNCLRLYDRELKSNDVRPSLGSLKDFAGIIEVSVGDPQADDEWKPALRVAFKTFLTNHKSLLKHFAQDPARERIFANTKIDEEAATGDKLVGPFKEVADVISEAHREGITTKDFADAVKATAELMSVIAYQNSIHSDDQNRPAKPLNNGAAEPVSVKKRSFLRALGFLERTYNLVGTTVGIATTQIGARILDRLMAAIDALSLFIK